jgi:hypothetical protein
VMLAKVASKDTETVVAALIKNARKLPQELYKSLTWDRGVGDSEEDVAEARCDDTADAKRHQRLHGRFAGRAAAEVRSGEKDRGIAELRLIQHAVRIFAAIGAVAQCFHRDRPELVPAETGHALDANDDVGIDVTELEGVLPGKANAGADPHDRSIRVRLHDRADGNRRRLTSQCGEAMKSVPQVFEVVDRDAEVAVELAEHLLRSRA